MRTDGTGSPFASLLEPHGALRAGTHCTVSAAHFYLRSFSTELSDSHVLVLTTPGGKDWPSNARAVQKYGIWIPGVCSALEKNFQQTLRGCKTNTEFCPYCTVHNVMRMLFVWKK